MPRIAVLPASLASQIAAGEVVERPASAVKELIENALDAGATRCDVEIEGGGVTRIAVSDDGDGMSPEDARLCVERHATSKLVALDDLGRLGTYGFRGEALPSIASVSRFCLRTRARAAEVGVEVRIDGGSQPECVPAGMPVGTSVEVRDLFYNVVARRKFLRSSGTESGHVADVVEAAALSHPEVTFTLHRDGRKVREWLRATSRAERIQLADEEPLAQCRGERGPLRIEAFLSRPERARPGASGLRLFVNGRPVRDRVLALTVAQAYGSVLERGRYPRGVVYLDIAPELVDVNVHPQKAEVRFVDQRAVSDALYRILSVELSRAFSLPAPARSQWSAARAPGAPPVVAFARGAPESPSGPAAPSPRDGAPESPSGPAAPSPPARNETPSSGVLLASEPAAADAIGVLAASFGATGGPAPADESAAAGYQASLHDTPVIDPPAREAPAPRPGSGARWSELRFVAQVRQMYLVCEGADGLYVIDQHAAAERVNFDRLRRQYESRAVSSQAMLFPLTLGVRPEETELVEERAKEFLALGLDVRVRGPETVSLHSVPKLLHRASPEQLVRDLLREVSRTGSRAFSGAVDLALATMACHGSIRAGDALSSDEATALLRSLDHADFAGHCPHGRPLVAFTSWGELERRVGRR